MTASTESKGRIRIVDADGVHVARSAQLEGDLTVDVTGEEPAVGPSRSAGQAPTAPSAAADAAGHATVLERPPVVRTLRAVLADLRSVWLALLPAATTVAAVALAAVFGPALWSVERSVLPAVAVRLGHVSWFLLGLAGTAWLWTDAGAVAEGPRSWAPAPLAYTLAGALLFAAGGTAFFTSGGHPPAELGGAFLGLVLVGLPTSAVVAGPAYLFARYRRLGTLHAGGRA